MLKIHPRLLELEKQAEIDLKEIFVGVDKVCEYNSRKILNAFIKNRITAETFHEVTGYGFFDSGRDKVEALFADVLGAEDTLIRPHIMSGTNAIWLMLSGLLHSGDTMICICGTPYDPLQNIVGITGNSKHSLINNGVKYEQIELIESDFDYDKIRERISKGDVNLVEIQRSRGYLRREGLSIEKIEKVCKLIKETDPNVIIVCDNCYGEMVEEKEPTEVGVDVIAGSLMHNLGGGVATSGGYIAGKSKLIEEIAERLTAPCIAKDLGANYGQHNKFLKGLFLSPQTVKGAVKTAIFTSYLVEKLGFEGVSPRYNLKRTDIVQTFDLETQENLEKFCQGIQAGSPIDSFVTPIPCEFPGYPHDEIMAAGTFTNGSTIELTCDAPVIPPYTAYMQGSLTFEYGKVAVLHALSNMIS
ncbi:MAG: methionine gamma-lyase family protein [Clostridia bacterium]|nr:methionine gamma-lyase family protein [Clostridia bacterium]